MTARSSTACSASDMKMRPKMRRRAFEEVLRGIDEDDRAAVQFVEQVDLGARRGEEPGDRRVLDDRLQSVADLVLGLIEGALLPLPADEVPDEKLPLNIPAAIG